MTLTRLNKTRVATVYGFKRALVWFALMLFAAGAAATTDDKSHDKLLVLGDSLSAAYRIDANLGWVSLLQQRLDETGVAFTVVNGSVSGNTTADGLARLPALLEHHKPAVLLVALGANDGLRGYPIKTMKANLLRIIKQGRASGAKVALIQMEIPPNYGKRYTRRFAAAFNEVAEQAYIAALPFFLYDIINQPRLMQADGIHPNALAQPHILETLWPSLHSLLPHVVSPKP